MINQYINPYSDWASTPDNFNIFYGDYIRDNDTKLQEIFLKLYARNIFGEDDCKEVSQLCTLYNIFFAFLMFHEQYDIDSVNTNIKTMTEYIDMFNMNCTGVKKKLMCMGIEYNTLIGFMSSDSGEFNGDFSNDFNG